MVKKFSYCLTINNPTPEDWQPFKDLDGNNIPNIVYTKTLDRKDVYAYTAHEAPLKKENFFVKREFKDIHPLMYKNFIQYIIYGNEKSKKGTKHYQMFIVFRRPVSFKFVKRLFPKAHIEPTRGSFHEANEYCKKQSKYYSYGYDIEKARELVILDNTVQSEIREELELKDRILRIEAQQNLINNKLEEIYRVIVKES